MYLMKSNLKLVLSVISACLSAGAFAVDVFGTVDHTSPSGIELTNHEIYTWADAKDLKVVLPTNTLGGLSDVRRGDTVRLVLDERHHVSGIVLLPKEPTDMIAVPVIKGTDFNWDSWQDVPQFNTIAGRTFSAARSRYLSGEKTLSVPIGNAAGFDLFDVYIGTHEETNPEQNGTLRFTFIGDDDVLYQSTFLRAGDRSIHIRGSVGRYRSLTIRIDHIGPGVRAVIADPTFFRVPRTVPVLTAPDPDSDLRGDTDLTWDKVDHAEGYLVELQCVTCQDAGDAKSPDRFISVRVDPDKTSYSFLATKLPKGKWRWRVHTLAGKQILGEMGMWRTFRNP